MLLRASYPTETKRGTLVHELAHRLAADVPFKGDHHELIFLFVYDVWVDLWGQPFADDQVRIESLRKGSSITRASGRKPWHSRPQSVLGACGYPGRALIRTRSPGP